MYTFMWFSLWAMLYILTLFLIEGILTVIATLLALYFDVALPNELKGFIFFAQVREKQWFYVHVNYAHK